jgi:hypothetical protein
LERWNGAGEVDDDFSAAGSFEGRVDDGDPERVNELGIVAIGMEELLRATAVDIGFNIRQKKEKVTLTYLQA